MLTNFTNKPDTYRTYCIMQAVENLIDFLESIKQKTIKSQIHEIALLNQQKLNCETPTFIFNNKKYSAINWIFGKDDNRILDISLRDTVAHILKANTFADVERISDLHQYFIELFQNINTKAGILKIIPFQLHAALAELNADIYDASPPVTDAQIQYFIDTHQHGNKLVKEHLALQLLLQ